MWNRISSSARRKLDYQEILDASPDCVLAIDRDRRIVEANEAAIRTFAGSGRHGVQRMERIEIEWLITDVADHYWRFGESLESLLDSKERHLSVTARRLDGMKFHANVRIVPIAEDPTVSHLLYLQGASERAVF